MRKAVIGLVVFIVIGLGLADSIYALSINNRDRRSHDIQVLGLRDGKRTFYKIHNNSFASVDCRFGCQVTVIETGDTKTFRPESSYNINVKSSLKAVVIMGGKLK
jgi:hypothetical protein